MIDKRVKRFVEKFRECKGEAEEREYINRMIGEIRIGMANKAK